MEQIEIQTEIKVIVSPIRGNIVVVADEFGNVQNAEILDGEKLVPRGSFNKWLEPTWDEDVQDFVEGAVIVVDLEELKNAKLAEIQKSSQDALKTFKLNGVTFEMSGESKANLLVIMPKILLGEITVFPWDALDGSYKWNEPDGIVLSKDVIFGEDGNPDTVRVEDFKNMFEIKSGQVFVWKKTQKYYLERAQTVEEIEAVSTEYPADPIPLVEEPPVDPITPDPITPDPIPPVEEPPVDPITPDPIP